MHFEVVQAAEPDGYEASHTAMVPLTVAFVAIWLARDEIMMLCLMLKRKGVWCIDEFVQLNCFVLVPESNCVILCHDIDNYNTDPRVPVANGESFL